MRQRIFFRVDASAVIGVGHFRRCLSLAHHLKDSGTAVRFVIRDHGLDICRLLGPFARDAVMLPSGQQPLRDNYSSWVGASLEQDIVDTVRGLETAPQDWAIVDHYGLDANWHDKIREVLGCKIAVIDDLANRRLSADLIIDQNWHADHAAKYRAVNLKRANILGGPRFAMIDRAFAEGPRWVPADTVASIGIFMGGGDTYDVTGAVLDALDAIGFEGAIEIATTSANPQLGRLRTRVAMRGNSCLLVDQDNLADFFARHDLQIGAGGGATWERCCAGAPTFAIAIAENQHQLLVPLAERGVLIAYLAKTLEVAPIAAAVAELVGSRDLRLHLSANASRLVDGRGTKRIVEVMTAEISQQIGVRLATLDDAERMFAWRNHPAVRAVSRDTAEISREDHLGWLDRSLATDTRVLLIGMTEIGEPVGVVRFDDLAGDAVEVSIYVDPARTGRGIGGRMLLAAEEHLVAWRNSALDIVAVVMPGNSGSERLFETGGYTKTLTGFRKRCSP